MEQVTDIVPLPRGSRLVHIGPPKTGTTALQSALHTHRAELANHGVLYASRLRHDRAAVAAVAFEVLPPGYPDDAPDRWNRLSRTVREANVDRVVVSSETLSYAPDAHLPRIVEDLGGSGLHVVITVRPLASMLPSRWQQSVQSFHDASYQEWLGRVFAPGAESDPQTRAMWRRFRVDRLAQRWGAQVGEENVTLIVLDPTDRSMLLTTFERLLGLPAGFLAPAGGKPNQSLPYPEVEMLRAFNRRFRAEGHSQALFVRAIRKNAMRRIKAIGEPVMRPYPIVTPAWAVEKANAVGAEMVEAIERSGVRVIGDLSHLFGVAPQDGPTEPPTAVPVDSAAEIAYAMFLAGRASGRPRRRRAPRPAVDAVPTRVLARELIRRARARVRRT